MRPGRLGWPTAGTRRWSKAGRPDAEGSVDSGLEKKALPPWKLGVGLGCQNGIAAVQGEFRQLARTHRCSWAPPGGGVVLLVFIRGPVGSRGDVTGLGRRRTAVKRVAGFLP